MASRPRLAGVLTAALFVLLPCNARSGTPPSGSHYAIKVVDATTSRGIPLAHVRTHNSIWLVTDSAGWAAFREPGLMDRDIFFEVSSDGYERPADGFGVKGARLHTAPGTTGTITLRRTQPAERMYRITGEGIYTDSVLLGLPVPVRHPLSNAEVSGQDGGLMTRYRDRLFWAYGDTGTARYPLAGNFKGTCAWSAAPDKGGLDPDIGVDLEYITSGTFAKQMVPLEHDRLYWISSLLPVTDATGRDRLVAPCSEVKAPMEGVAHLMVEFDDEQEVFNLLRRDPLTERVRLEGPAYRVREGDTEYLYFSQGLRHVRVPATYEAVVDKTRYEAFTCLENGASFTTATDILDREDDGAPRYSWKRDTEPVGTAEEDKLVSAGLIRASERRFAITDPATGKRVQYHAGMISWNEWRKRYVLVFCEVFGKSFLGETWYAESTSPVGPWTNARKIATHTDYNLYNPVQHPELAKSDGRIIYFSGCYVNTFLASKIPTPRYNYNMVMYRLALDDPLLDLPPVD